MIEKIKKTFTFKKADWVALLLIALTLIWQFGTYFISKYALTDLHVVNSNIDNQIPFIKYFVVFYVIWYAMIWIVPFMISRRDRGLFHVYIITYNLMFIAALITFIAYPTIVEIPELKTTDFFTWLMNLIYEKDYPPINCIPSGHTMACTAMIFGTVLCKKMKPSTKSIIIVINVLTICSTVFTKQHALIDLVFAFVYTTVIFVVVWLIYYKVYKKS